MKNEKRFVFGVIVILIGLGFLLDQFGLFAVWNFSFGWLIATFWPVILIIIGLAQLSGGKTASGLILFGLGAIFQVSTLTSWSFWSLLWPLIIVVVGIAILAKKPGIFKKESSDSSAQEKIDEKVVFWGLEKKITSKNFKGGKIECTFGGAEINLKDARIAPEGAELNITCNFGGVEIEVPKDMNVEVEGKASMGSWKNKTDSSGEAEGPVLKITGSVSFGGVEVKN